MASHVFILRRVGVAMLVYVGLRTAGLVFDFVTGASHSVTIDLLSLVLGLLLLRGSLGAARWVAFLSGFELAATALGFGIGVPLLLWFGRGLPSGFPVGASLWWGVVEIAFDVLFAVWVLRQLRQPEVEEALVWRQRGSIRRAQRWGVGFGGGMMALVAAILVPLALMWPRVAAPAVAEAHRRLGDDWAIQVTSYHWGPAAWKAHVVARRGDQVQELDVGGPR